MEAKGAAVVTGASRGIGRAVAIELAARGFDTVATMRDPAAGAESRRTGLRVERLDVIDPESIALPDRPARPREQRRGRERQPPARVHADRERGARIFATNVFGLVEVTQARECRSCAPRAAA